MARKIDRRTLNRFLRERGLSTQYDRFVRLKSKPKRKLDIVQTTETGDAIRRTLVFTKERGKTIVRDNKSLDVLATSKKSIPKVISDLTSKMKRIENVQVKYTKIGRDDSGKRTKTKIDFSGVNISIDSVMSKLKLKLESKKLSYDPKSEILRTTLTTNSPKRSKVGNVVVNAIVIRQDGTQAEVTARSRGGFNLGRASERNEALQDAIHNASIVAWDGISTRYPDQIIVKHFWYEYRYDKRERLKTVHW